MNKIILLVFSMAIIIALQGTNVSAELPNNTFEPDTEVNYFVYCIYLNNSICTNATSCEITAFNPDTTILIKQGKMSYNGSGFFNYSFGVLEDVGEYSTLIHCNNTEEGVINSFFTVGILETLYDNLFWFYIFMFLIPVILIILSKITDDKWFAVFGSIILICFGIYLQANGLPYFDNNVVETAIWSITLGIGLYFMLSNSTKLIEEAGL